MAQPVGVEAACEPHVLRPQTGWWPMAWRGLTVDQVLPALRWLRLHAVPCDAMRCDAMRVRVRVRTSMPERRWSAPRGGAAPVRLLCWGNLRCLKVRVRRVWSERNTRHSRPQNRRAHGAEWCRGQRVDQRAPRAGNDVEGRPLCTRHFSVSSRLIAPTPALRIKVVSGVAIVSPPSVGSGKPLTGVARWQCVPSMIWALECRC